MPSTAVSNGKVYVIEVNPASMRTVPYISKVTGVLMVDLVVCCRASARSFTDMGYGTGLHPNALCGRQGAVFSFEKPHGVDTQFGPEMKSSPARCWALPPLPRCPAQGLLIGAGYTFKTPLARLPACIFTVKDSDKPEFVWTSPGSSEHGL